jgi:hypothetical protein
MRDVQQSVADYYAATATGGDLGRHVRTFLVGAQTLNELFSNAVADAATYTAVLAGADQAEVDLIQGIKYARNVVQHVLHIIRPADDNFALVGGMQGMRVYASWDEIPADAHAKLNRGTQKLKPAYDDALHEHEVTGTMFALLRFYGRIAPNIVHRDHQGEWTGFPLMSQPGVASPLHPEEPSDVETAWAWLDSRRPSGDARVICGQLSLDGTNYAYGYTFVGRHSFAPWAESIEQVNIDISRGYPYLAGDPSKNVEDVTRLFPRARQGGVLMSLGDLESWTNAVIKVDAAKDWCADTRVDEWGRIVRLEHGGFLPKFKAYELRRARRLNALIPPNS